MRDANSYLCIPAVNLTTASPWVFKTDHDPTLTRDANILMKDVALATSAAPFYLPVAVSEDIPGGQYVDGGLWANNPAFVGLIEACRFFAGPGKPYKSVHILSIPSLSPASGRPAGERRGLSVLTSGQEISTVALAIQQKCTANFINLVSLSLQVPVTYLRIPAPELAPQHIKNLGLDIASKKAIETLIHLGQTTGHTWNKKPEVTAFFKARADKPTFNSQHKGA
ncbi:MAG: patatin-like phospholipase family protein [Anaerolineae bacterium]|nr:patatin-like phospholipase family protein [Anaerolineae bacterium]